MNSLRAWWEKGIRVSCAKTDCGGPKSRRFSRKCLPSRARARSPVRQVAGTGPTTLKPGPVGAEKGRGSSGGAEGERESDGRGEGGDDGAPRPHCAGRGRRHPAALWTCVARRRTGRGKGASSLASAADSPKDKEVGSWKIGERQPHFFGAVFVGQTGAQTPTREQGFAMAMPSSAAPARAAERRRAGESAVRASLLPSGGPRRAQIAHLHARRPFTHAPHLLPPSTPPNNSVLSPYSLPARSCSSSWLGRSRPHKQLPHRSPPCARGPSGA